MTTLIVERLGGRRVEASLEEADVELIREAVRHHAVQSSKLMRPLIVQRSTPAARYLVDSPSPLKIAGYLEAAREYQAVNVVLSGFMNEPAAGDALDTLRP